MFMFVFSVIKLPHPFEELHQICLLSEETDFFSFTTAFKIVWVSLVAQLVKNPPAMLETWVRSLGWEDPLEKGKVRFLSPEVPLEKG